MSVFLSALIFLIQPSHGGKGNWTSNDDYGYNPMPDPYSQMITAYNANLEKIILLGGYNSRNSTILFDIATKTFTSGSDLSTSLYANDGQNHVQPSIASKYVWILIPDTGEGLYRYDLISNTFTTFTNTDIFFDGYEQGACIAYLNNVNGEYIIISGGQYSTGNQIHTYNSMAIYDIDNNKFDTNQNYQDIIQDSRSGHTCIVHPNNTNFYVIGGEDDGFIVATIEYYDMTQYYYEIGTIDGDVAEGIRCEVTRARSFAMDQYIFILGGHIKISNTQSKVWRYNIFTNSIELDQDETGSFNLSLAFGVYDAAFVQTADYVYLFGGKIRTTFYDTWQSQELSLNTTDPTASPTAAPTGSPTLTLSLGWRGDWESNDDKGADEMLYGASQMIPAYKEETREIYLLGGVSTNTSQMIFDINTQTFIMGDTLPLSNGIWNKLGGQQYVQNKDTLWILAPNAGIHIMRYSISTNEFTTNVYNDSSGRQQGGSCIAYFSNKYGEYLVITGGEVVWGESTATTGKTLIYDIVNNRMDDSQGGIDDSRAGHTCLVHPNNTKLYAFGGYGSTEDRDSIESLDLSKYDATDVIGDWDMAEARYMIKYAKSFAYQHFIFILGGINENGASSNIVMKYDILTEQLSIDRDSTDIAMPLSYGVYDAAFVQTYDEVYLFGGITASSSPSGDLSTWQSQQIIPTAMPTISPSAAPSQPPTFSPTLAPTDSPTEAGLISKTGTCPDGYQVWSEDSSFCQPCPARQAGTLGECNVCGDGKEPSDDKSECVLCDGEIIGAGGSCDVDCNDNGKISNELHTECVENAAAEEWYETSEFDAIISILGTLTGFSCIGALCWAFCKKKLCFKEDGKETNTNDKTQEMVQTQHAQHAVVTSTSDINYGDNQTIR